MRLSGAGALDFLPMHRLPALLLLPLAVAVLAGGCSSTTLKVGRDFDLDGVSAKIQRGTTREEEVRAWLGSPGATGVSVEPDGRTLTQWTYFYGAGDLASLTDTTIKTLQVKFDGQGLVQGYNWSSSKR